MGRLHHGSHGGRTTGRRDTVSFPDIDNLPEGVTQSVFTFEVQKARQVLEVLLLIPEENIDLYTFNLASVNEGTQLENYGRAMGLI